MPSSNPPEIMQPATLHCPLYNLTCHAATLAGVAHSRVFSAEKTDPACRVRYAVWHILYNSRGWTLHRIREAAGYGHHGTILHGLRRAQELIVQDPAFAQLIAQLTNLKTPN
jgi:hypothetical protein